LCERSFEGLTGNLTTSKGIKFQSGEATLGYADSDFAGELDTGRSRTGYVFVMAGGAISWKSNLQTTVATSSTEAEYMAASDAAKEAVWLRRLLGDLGMDVCFQILVDNSGALFQVQNDAICDNIKTYTKRSKAKALGP
jgi:hypothetical protein